MPAYSSKGKVEDDKIIQREAGAYNVKITKIEKRPGPKGEYLSLTLTVYPEEGNTFEIFDRLLINSKEEYPQNYIKRYLAILGFYKRESDTFEIEEWDMMKQMSFHVILRKEEQWHQKSGSVKAFLEIHSIYSHLYLSPGEVMEGKTEALKFAENLEWVQANPLKKMKGAPPAASAPKSTGDAF